MHIGNNLIAPSTKSLKTKVVLEPKGGSGGNFSGDLDFLYDNRYGIVLSAGAKGRAPAQPADSELHPVLWQALKSADGPPTGTNLSIAANYVYQNGRVGISWAADDGGAKERGTGVRVTGNHVEVASGTTCYSVEGKHLASGSDTNENRGYDQSGAGMLVQNNTGNINRQYVPDSKPPYKRSTYMTTDGEGARGSDRRRVSRSKQSRQPVSCVTVRHGFSPLLFFPRLWWVRFWY